MSALGDALFREMSTLVREQQAETTGKPKGHFEWCSHPAPGGGIVIIQPYGTDANNFIEDNIDFKNQRFARIGEDWQDWRFVMCEDDASVVTDIIAAGGFHIYEIEVES